MSLARPSQSMMRYPLRNALKTQVMIATGISLAASTLWYFAVMKPRYAAYANFHQTYNDERHFKRMAAAGIFDSVKPEAGAPSWVADYEKEVDKAIAALKKK